MTARELTKSQKRALRELAGRAYDRELSAALTKIESEFQRWRAGEIDAFELEARIHRFHQGPARKLYSRYSHSDVLLQVAAAFFHGVLTERDLPSELVPAIEPHVAFLRSHHEPVALSDEPPSDV